MSNSVIHIAANNQRWLQLQDTWWLVSPLQACTTENHFLPYSPASIIIHETHKVGLSLLELCPCHHHVLLRHLGLLVCHRLPEAARSHIHETQFNFAHHKALRAERAAAYLCLPAGFNAYYLNAQVVFGRCHRQRRGKRKHSIVIVTQR